MAELKISKEMLDEAFNNALDQIQLDTGMTLTECVEKQIPMDVKSSIIYDWCPSCNSILHDVADMKVFYCQHCGQRIKR